MTEAAHSGSLSRKSLVPYWASPPSAKHIRDGWYRHDNQICLLVMTVMVLAELNDFAVSCSSVDSFAFIDTTANCADSSAAASIDTSDLYSRVSVTEVKVARPPMMVDRTR